MPELENHLIAQNECYICFEPARRRSPCHCTTYVHRECLSKYMEASDATACKVCLAPFEMYPWYIRTYGSVCLMFVILSIGAGAKLMSMMTDEAFATFFSICLALIIINVYMIQTKPTCLRKSL
ncbi:hypothetical protein N9A45_00590 [bacterium]|nr:hypothetical protein [bacterium]